MGKTVSAAYEDVQLVIMDNKFANIISDALDARENGIEMEIDNNCDDEGVEDNNNRTLPVDEVDFTIRNEEMTPIIDDNIEIYLPLDNHYYSGLVE